MSSAGGEGEAGDDDEGDDDDCDYDYDYDDDEEEYDDGNNEDYGYAEVNSRNGQRIRQNNGHRSQGSGNAVDLGISDASSLSGGAWHSRTNSAATGGPMSSAMSGGASSIGGQAQPSTSTDAMSASGSGRKSTSSNNPIKQYKDYKMRSRDLHRRHRGLMQW